METTQSESVKTAAFRVVYRAAMDQAAAFIKSRANDGLTIDLCIASARIAKEGGLEKQEITTPAKMAVVMLSDMKDLRAKNIERVGLIKKEFGLRE